MMSREENLIKRAHSWIDSLKAALRPHDKTKQIEAIAQHIEPSPKRDGRALWYYEHWLDKPNDLLSFNIESVSIEGNIAKVSFSYEWESKNQDPNEIEKETREFIEIDQEWYRYFEDN